MATETFSMFGPPRSFCTCGDPSCGGDCNLPPVEDVSDLVDAGVWQQRFCPVPRVSRIGEAARPAPEKGMQEFTAEPVVEDAADLFAAGVWEHKLV